MQDRSWVEIDTKAIRRNVRALRSVLGKGAELAGVVKSNAYGHGLVPFARELEKAGISRLAVDSLEEALELRKAKILLPILVLGYVPPADMPLAAMKDVAVTVSSPATLKALQKVPLRKTLKAHIKADTGLGRQGFVADPREVALACQKIPKIAIEGLYTHFAIAEDPSRIAYTRKQAEGLRNWAEEFKEAGFSPLLHASATSGILFGKELHFDLVRAGIGLYGLWPSGEVKEHAGKKVTLSPVLSWKAIVSEVKDLPKGSRIGYDCTHTLSRDSRLAVIPVGYWHGYPRSLSGRGEVSIRGRKAPVIGRISMDMLSVDVTDIPGVKAGDAAELLGKGMPAEAVAEAAGTINYEIVTRINPAIPRRYR